MFTSKYTFTIGVEFKKKQQIAEGANVEYTSWDTAGQECYRGIISAYYSGAHVIALCLDLSDAPNNVGIGAKKFLDEIKQYGSSGVPVCIIGTKADLAALTDRAAHVANNRAYLNTLTSESTDCNIQGVFVTSAKEKNNATYNQRIDGVVVDPNAPTINSLDTVMDSVRSVGLRQVRSLKKGNRAVATVQSSVQESPKKLLLSALDEKHITAGVLRGIISHYSSTSIWGENNRHSAMKKLDNLLLEKDDNDELNGSDVVNCLGSHGYFFSKQRKIEAHLTNNTTPEASTEKVYVEIYTEMMKPSSSR